VCARQDFVSSKAAGERPFWVSQRFSKFLDVHEKNALLLLISNYRSIFLAT
jgi:hypothetical protein